MTSLPAPLLRALSVLALGGALAMGHIAFASAAPRPTGPAQVASVDVTGSVDAGEDLAENCYRERIQEQVAGRIVTRVVLECD
jgi:hypothetical protein